MVLSLYFMYTYCLQTQTLQYCLYSLCIPAVYRQYFVLSMQSMYPQVYIDCIDSTIGVHRLNRQDFLVYVYRYTQTKQTVLQSLCLQTIGIHRLYSTVYVYINYIDSTLWTTGIHRLNRQYYIVYVYTLQIHTDYTDSAIYLMSINYRYTSTIQTEPFSLCLQTIGILHRLHSTVQVIGIHRLNRHIPIVYGHRLYGILHRLHSTVYVDTLLTIELSCIHHKQHVQTKMLQSLCIHRQYYRVYVHLEYCVDVQY